ncbi:MAG: hypothetical protein A2359_02185 [Candidatus Moranbacteria bacterium RIFOXYB1_FULL_43_19]|nr:MAG: hypothetical protein A2359_02185 [Candidatus Moranbacteria bacterium RIFOXYB1_FULL_43_19]OGI33328.1 MAG: hypothetical protein A2420_03465 [Candidatus Moranbacteria bacterium RIFOXYC1_FULL_44_13]OGI37512.1 MAG: hypothetical protein A2612_05235 [Candidatus Moranbacteria bacterium RIFOXYD1_FULL_44_12]
MSKAGQYNYKGINSQAWAAMSLFFQYLRDPKFLSIQLEAANFEDFNIVFDDGKKIICESKDRKEKFSYPQLKEILENIIKKGSLGDKDEVLIICSKANTDLISDVHNVKYFKQLQNKFVKKGYSAQLLSLLPKVQFWVVPAAFNENVIYSLFAELINFWLPPEDIKRFVDNILIQKIYKGSASGATYSRNNIVEEIEKFKEEIQTSSDYFNLKIKREEQFVALEKIVNSNGKITLGSRSISAFSIRWDLMSFAMDRLKTRTELDLKKWDKLWQLNKVYHFTFGIFDVFENNLQTEKNIKYVLGYIKKYTKTSRSFYRSDFFDVDVIKILTKIIDSKNGKKYLDDAFIIVKDLLTFDGQQFFYIKDNDFDHGKWEKEQICKLLHKIYNIGDPNIEEKTFRLIINVFNIIEDDSEFSHYSPKEVFDILIDWINKLTKGKDFLNRFEGLVKEVVNQYDKFYKTYSKNISFDGWEHSGGGISFSGSHHVYDRHFVNVFTNAIDKYYTKNENDCWNFIKERCLSKTDKKAKNKVITKPVSKQRPDFLNRSVYHIVLKRYASADKKTSGEAFEILKELILSRRGIPHKSDLIYQAVVGSDLIDDKKWRLVELTTKKYGVPVNPFVEQIITNLAKNGHAKAKAELKKWFASPDYYKHRLLEIDSVLSIRAFLDVDSDFSVELFKSFLKSEYVQSEKGDAFGAYDVAGLLHDILNKDYSKGLEILRDLEGEKRLNKSQQIIFAYSLFNNRGNDKATDLTFLNKIYKDALDPYLKSTGNDIKKIYQRFYDDSCRSAFVQFAVRLAAHKQIDKAIRIIKVFINDPDPYLSGEDPNDKEDKYNEHKKIEQGEEPSTITSVRGWCGWTLMKCPILEGRSQLNEIIKLVKKLSEDKNYYVIHMACFALGQLARNRLTVLPSDRNTLFFDDNKEKALKMSKKVEKIAFDLLDRLVSWPVNVQKAMTKSILHAFDPIRSLNEADSWKLVTNLRKLPIEAIDEAASLFIYLAEFRKDAYIKWRFSLPGLYDDLGPGKFNDKKFKKAIKEIIKDMQKQDPDSCFKFAASVEHLMREIAVKENKVDEYEKLALEYLDFMTDKYAHNIYNLIYQTIEKKLQEKDAKHINNWYNLLLKCFKNEAIFYEQTKKSGKLSEVRWYPTLYHSRILELISEKMGKDKFMEVAKIFFSFPNEIDLHESDAIVSVIRELSKSDKDAKKIIKNLFNRNPSKYWDLNKK